MRTTTIAALTPAALADAFSLVYTGYAVPFVVDEEWARYHLAAYDIAPEHSVLWTDDDGATLGLSLLGVREGRGWIGGFGIAPAWRGQGLAHRLIAAALDRARRAGLREVQLEVLSNNPRAIATYERAGFVRRRDLRILRHPADLPAGTARQGAIQSSDPASLLPHGPRLRAVPPAWQREPASWADLGGLQGLALDAPGAPDAYLIYRAGASAAQIVDFAAPDADRAAALAAALAAHLPGRVLSLTNEPAESPVCVALDQAGWQEPLRQHELVIALT